MRKLSLSSALKVALEDNELFPVVTPETTSEIEETLIELDESYDEAKDAVEVVEELEDRQEQVEELVESAEHYTAQGGMTVDGAAMYHLQLARLGRGLEALHGDNLVMSSESYASKDRMTASLEAVEKGKNFAQKLWETIVTMAKAAYDAIVNFFGRLLNSNAKLRRQADALKKKAEALGRGAKKKEGTVGFAGGVWARNLADPRGGISPAGAVKAIDDLRTALTSVRAACQKDAQVGLDGPVDTILNAIKAVDSSLPGSYRVEVTQDGFAVTRKEVSVPENIDALAPSEAAKLCTAVDNLLKTLDGFSTDAKSAMKRLTDSAAKGAKGASDADKEAAAKFKKRLSTARKASLEFPKIAGDAARSALIYANKSINAYSAGTKEENTTALKNELKTNRDTRRSFGG